MKIAIIGGASLRTPLLARALDASALPIDELTLYDTDRARLAGIAGLARALCHRATVRACDTSADCVRGARFVVTSIRVGGIACRAEDERLALSLGLVGQETVGAAGCALALRTIGPMVAYAREIEALAPDAWLINFTNPVGLVTQAVLAGADVRAIGICDTPTELFHDTARALDLDATRCIFDYFGLNHLGWLREVYADGTPQLHRVWNDPGVLARIYRQPLFDADELGRLRLLPTEYLYYYDRPALATARLQRAGTTRGEAIERLNARFMARLGEGAPDVVDAYDAYLAERSAGYMQLEAGTAGDPAAAPDGSAAATTGYDRIALATIESIHFDRRDIIPLDVPNEGNLPDLEPDDVVEVPCVVGANGAFPLHVADWNGLPERVRSLMRQVKRYERLTIRAAMERSSTLSREALVTNPLVGSPERADALLRGMKSPW